MVANLIKEGAEVNEKNHVSLQQVLSASVCIDGYVNDSHHGNLHMHGLVGCMCACYTYVSLSLYNVFHTYISRLYVIHVIRVCISVCVSVCV